MTFNRTPITVEAAQKAIESYIKPAETETVDLLGGEGRRIAENVKSTHPIPHFRRSGMDGFAVRSEDIAEASSDHPITLVVQEEIACGAVPDKVVESGSCARIMTGAAVPDGADAVIKLEDIESGDHNERPAITLKSSIKHGENITEIGTEVTEGSLMIKKGARITAGELALLATFGYAKVKVYSQPKIAILSTGSELLQVNDTLQPGKIRNSNSYMLASQVKNAGGDIVMLDQVPDDIAFAEEKIMQAFKNADIVITTGGVSVGDYDILVDIFARWDGHMLFNKLQMRPGSPTTVGVRNNQLLFALSGNPGACFAGFELFIRPVIWGMQGKDSYHLPEFRAHLTQDFTNKGAFPRYVRGRSYMEDGKMFVEPVGLDKSSVVVSIKDADVLIKIPPGKIELKANQLVSVLKLEVSE